MSAKAILTDTTLCTGCEQCVQACKRENQLGEDVSRRWKQHIDDLSSTRYTTLIHRPGNRHVRQQCRHCLRPACVSACLVGALHKLPDGPVVYENDRCMGCRYCMMSCPYGIPRYAWELAVPYVRKCTMCAPRVEAGQQPACTEACDRKATIFGTREELLAEAHRRIAQNPSRYVNRVFGETEVGGTSVLYISDIPLDFLAFKASMGETPLDQLTWAALSKVPPLALGMGSLMAGIWWITGRRAKVAEEAAARAAAEQARATAADEKGPASAAAPDKEPKP
jgi:formate dehydrogenase iron-sulfur subunit